MLDEIAVLMPGLTPATAALAILVCFTASVIGGMSGFGAGLIVTLFLTPVVGPKAVIPMISATMLITNASRVWFLRGALDLRTVLVVVSAAIPAAAAGALVYVSLEPGAVQALLGSMLLLSIPARRWLEARKVNPGTTGKVAIGGIYGFLSTMIVGAGMLIIPMLMGAGLAGAALLATDAAIASVVGLGRVVFFSSLDALTLPMFAVSVAMGIVMIPGTWLAAWIVKRTSMRVHTLFIECIIVVGGVGMVVTAPA